MYFWSLQLQIKHLFMKEFLKSLLATILGVIISGVLLFVIFLIVMGSIVASSSKPFDVKSNSVFYLDLDRQIVDRQPQTTVNIPGLQGDYRLGLNSILDNIQKARDDDRIKGIYIEAKTIETGYATLDEIRKALIDFRESGKFVVFYTEILTQKAYYLATASDKIFFNPTGMLMLNGLRLQSIHYKNAFDKLGIQPVVVKMGKYKGATESFDRAHISEPNREQLTRLVESVWENMSLEIRNSRSVDIDSLNDALNNLRLETAQDGLDLHLFDSLVYKSDVISYLKNQLGIPEGKDINTVTNNQYSLVDRKNKVKLSNDEKIAVIYASGTILDGESDDNNIGGERFARLFRKVRKDSAVKAIVLRVNSPGGSGLASEIILDEIIRTKGVKPIVVSMGDVAASGGYYISCAADSIIAGKNTITGSIGVFFRSIEASGLMNKLGITFDVVKTHNHADLYSITRPYTEDEIIYTQHSIETMYNQFLSRVSNGRNIDRDTVNSIAQGRVWSGADAEKIGLIDSYGGIEEAIGAAKYLAHLGDNVQIDELPALETPIEKLIKDLSGETKMKTIAKELGIDEQTYRDVKTYLQCQGIVTALPFSFRID